MFSPAFVRKMNAINEHIALPKFPITLRTFKVIKNTLETIDILLRVVI